MDLQKNSIEYAHLYLANVPDTASVQASLDLNSWVNAEDGDGDGEYLILLRGPAATGSDGMLVAQSTELWVKVSSSPEAVVRSAGSIDLY